jgi:uncharacterized protein involved in type VI secretion and phage assembly
MIEQALFACDAIESCTVVGVAGEEAIGVLPRWTVDVVSVDGEVALDRLVDEGARLALADDGGDTRSMALQITGASYRGPKSASAIPVHVHGNAHGDRGSRSVI